MTRQINTTPWLHKYTILTLLYALFSLTVVGVTTAIAAPTGNDDIEVGHDDDIVDVAIQAGSFKTLVAAVKAAGLVETLKGDGPFTVFAPTDEAFAKLPRGTVENLLKPENKDQLIALLTFHVVPGKIKSSDLLQATKAMTVNGASLPIGLRIGEATVTTADVNASNGVIHIIDTVLMPQPALSQAEMARDLIEMAINRGAPLYNMGQTAACAAIYEVTAMALINFNEELPASAQRSLRKALERMRHSRDHSERAWIMREGLDEAYDRLTSRRMMSTASARH